MREKSPLVNPEGLRAVRQRLGLSQEDFATRLGYDRRTVQRWESGETAPKRATVLFLQRMVREETSGPQINNGRHDFTFIDLFAGIGGMRLGFEANGGRCVYTSEWDRFCQQTYAANFPGDENIGGDITEIGSSEIPGHDVLLAGFPCQPFSLAGVSKKNSLGRPHGFACEAQGTLFFEIARILRDHRPAAFLLENVKHLKNHDAGRTMDVILRTLEDELGYNVTTRVIDARAFLPQHRERVFLAGFREDTGFDMDNLELPDPDEGPCLEAILHPEDGSEEPEPPYTAGDLGVVSGKYTLSDKLWTYLQEYAERHRRRGNGFGFGLVGPEDVARTLSARYYKDGSEILVRQEDSNPRRLTPRECARLLGFDRPGHPRFEIPVSDTQAYKQFGNSVAVPVVEAIAEGMRPHIRRLAMGRDQLELAPLVATA